MHVSKVYFPMFAALSAGLIAASLPVGSAFAVTFGQKEVDQSKFIAIAKPVGQDSHQLIILEQVNDKKQCWSESSAQPVIVDPLLLKFDFTGICGRSTDANGYSIRMDGQDLGGKYTLRIRYRNSDMVLVGSPDDPKDPEIVIGHTSGMAKDFAKIQLDPGWYFSKRTFTIPKTEKTPETVKVLGHVYLTRDGGGETLPFGDVAGDVYLKEIKAAVGLKFIAGFQDSTFRPTTPLTREQLVSMVLEALKTLPGVNLTVPTTVTTNPYPDVDTKRWSATKIAFARDNKIVTGYQDGTFAPEKPVTRAELLAVLKRAAEYAKSLNKQLTTLAPTQAAFTFTDTQGHWAADLITQMSSYCGVASPFNEAGTAFSPNEPAFRNYSAAATLRTLNCLKNPKTPYVVPPVAKPTTPPTPPVAKPTTPPASATPPAAKPTPPTAKPTPSPTPPATKPTIAPVAKPTAPTPSVPKPVTPSTTKPVTTPVTKPAT